MERQYYGNHQDAYYHDPNEPKNKRKKQAPLALIVAISLVAGLAGGGLSWQYLNSNDHESMVEKPIVTIQTVEANEISTTATQTYYSVAEEVAAIAGPSVVEISTESKKTHPFFGSYVTGGAGSGVIISNDGYIATNHHVLEGSSAVSVRLSDGSTYSAKLIGTDSQTDLAVIKIEAQGLSPAILADSSSVKVGQPVVAIGNPLGTLGGTVTDGIISAKDREIIVGDDVMQLLQTSAAINPGNSGGGLFNKDSQLIGVVNAKSSGSDIEGLGFAIPANTVKTVVTELIEHGYVTGRPSLGIGTVEVKSVESLYQYRVNEYGVYVSSASSDSELQSGDRLLSIDGETVSSSADMKRIIQRHSVGDSVEVAFQRNGRTRTITVSLVEHYQEND